jgi:DNA polymerase IV
MKADSIPPNVILVNEDYPIDCTQYISILDPNQRQYAVSGHSADLRKLVVP